MTKRRAKRKEPIGWWQPPPGTEQWLLAVLEHLETEETERLRRKRERLSAENFLSYQFTEGSNDRAHSLFSVLQAHLPELERQRFRLWINEGYFPPMARPHGNAEVRIPLPSGPVLAGEASPVRCNGDAEPRRSTSGEGAGAGDPAGR